MNNFTRLFLSFFSAAIEI